MKIEDQQPAADQDTGSVESAYGLKVVLFVELDQLAILLLTAVTKEDAAAAIADSNASGTSSLQSRRIAVMTKQQERPESPVLQRCIHAGES